MARRSDYRELFLNNNELYEKTLRDKGLKNIEHYGRLLLEGMTPKEIKELTISDHIWKTGDRFYKLAYEYYGDARYWWIIAFFNKRPIDNLCKLGDVINIPLPLEDVLYYITKNVRD
tara:strand:- start:112 stop:462 length:351 start_codon:yes stop_codon:yes gene_type:complete